MRRDIYATSSSSSSDDDCEITSKEHSLNSLHFSCFDADIYELENGDIISPWTNSNDEEAPELLDVPDPCSFREVLDTMDQSEENKLAEFTAAIPIHVSAELLPSTNIKTLLLSK